MQTQKKNYIITIQNCHTSITMYQGNLYQIITFTLVHCITFKNTTIKVVCFWQVRPTSRESREKKYI